ncbi:MAG TPA: rhomboid family intramembrane serine protease [Gemmatimonadaceae bacterium]|nr:rhomboid family intramembrane serine protease [Gemmatimonadaceae bacterium]
MTPWVVRLLVANVAVFLLTAANPELRILLAFQPDTVLTHPWTPFTYMYVHGSIGHIFFNMLALWFFGPRVEERLGGTRFFTMYTVSGLAGAALSLFTPSAVIVGASGAVYGVLYAYAHFWPHDKIYLYGVLPIEARLFVLIMTVLALYGGWNSGFQPGIAHFAHLGGFVGGAIYLYLVERRAPSRGSAARVGDALRRTVSQKEDVARWSSIRRDQLHEINRSEVDRLLDKIRASGVGSLTDDERAALDRFSGK